MEFRRFEPWEDELILQNYERLGVKIPGLSHRTKESIQQRAAKLGVRYDFRSWHPWEDELIRQSYATMGTNIAGLEHRTPGAIQFRAAKLGCKYTKHAGWTEAEIELLKNGWMEHYTKIPGLEHRSEQNIRRKAAELGLPPHNRWYEHEIEILRKQYPTKGTDIPELAHHGPVGIMFKANQLGIKRDLHSIKKWNAWEPEEDSIIINEYPELGSKVAAKLPGRSETAVIARAAELGVRSWMKSGNDIASTSKVPTEPGHAEVYWCVCKVCGSVMLLRREELAKFKHSELCKTRRAPKTVRIPWSLVAGTKKMTGVDLRDLGYKSR